MRRVPDSGQSLRVVVKLRQDVSGDERALPDGVDVNVDSLPHLVLERRIRAEQAAHGRDQARGRVAKNRLGEPVLGTEVVVEQCLIDPRFGGNLLHAGPGRAPLDEDLSGSLQDTLLGVGVGVRIGGPKSFTRHFN